MHSVGEMFTAINNPEAAEPLLRNVVLKRKEVFGLTHLSVAQSDHALGVCLIKMGRYDEAKPFFEEEELVQSSVLGRENKLVNNAREERQRLLSAAR
jgi:hypothetical protein